jgi:hypothetical protein
MAVGTILGASYWSAWSAREAVNEQEKLLKVLSPSLHHLSFWIFVKKKLTRTLFVRMATKV